MGGDKKFWIVGALSMVLVAGLLAVFTLFTHAPPPADCQFTPAAVTAPSGGNGSKKGFDTEQLSIATRVNAVVNARNDIPASNKADAVMIALVAGLTESGLHNVAYGTGQSLGIWQMTPPDWGTRRQIMNVNYAINKFLNVLLTVPTWKTADYGTTAQDVERSAYPGRYATHIADAQRLYSLVVGDQPTTDCLATSQFDQQLNTAIEAALGQVGNSYTYGQPADGASFVSWAFQQAGLSLPATLAQLASFNNDPTSGLSASWIPASSIKSGASTLTPGDILFWSDHQSKPTRSNVTRTGLYVGTGATGNELRVATYNVRGSTHTAATGPESGPERIKRAAALITSQRFAVVGMQELQANQRAQLLRSLGSGYGIYPTQPQYGLHVPGINSVNSIIWDKSQVSFESGSSLPMPYYFNRRSMHIPLVKLKQLASGREFYVANTHDPAMTPFAELRYLDAQQHAADANALVQQGLPVIFTGDFNSSYSEKARSNPVWQHQRQNMTWCVMTRSGAMLDGYDASRRPVRYGECPPQTTKELGIGIVDHVYVSRDISVTGYHVVWSRTTTASDHHVVYIDTKLPGATVKPLKNVGKYGEYVGVNGKGKIALQSVNLHSFAGALHLSMSATDGQDTSGPWTQPLKQPCNLTSPYGWSNSSIRGYSFHDGDDCSTPVGTPVYAAHGGTIQDAAYGSASGNQVIIDNDGTRNAGMGTKYEHLNSFAPGISPGTAVSAGQLIGYSGQTGSATGPHLHFSVCTDTGTCALGSGAKGSATTDPLPFMAAHGADLMK